ncbi:MAG: glycerol-3-phosphate 1-O-acyltransferase PlsY [Bacteroidia bacterium]
MVFTDIVIYVLCFLCGALPFAVWIGQLFFNKDVRKFGSGNPGATNTLRTLGAKPALAVLLLDIAKGSMAVFLAYFFIESNYILTKHEAMALGGGLAILGHIFSPFLHFKGGKGVATTIGVILALHSGIVFFVIMSFIIVLALTKFVSLASIIAATVYAVLVIIFRPESQFVMGFAIFVAVLVIYKHKANITRLLHGEENKLSFRKS